jgi:hypothetical protein
MQKLVLEISELAVKSMLIPLFPTQELVSDTLEATRVRMPKMMPPATQTRCLKYSHTNLQRYIGIGT